MPLLIVLCFMYFVELRVSGDETGILQNLNGNVLGVFRE